MMILQWLFSWTKGIIVDSEDIPVSLTSILNTKAVSVQSSITSTGVSLNSLVTESESLTSILNTARISLKADINDKGVSMSTEL